MKKHAVGAGYREKAGISLAAILLCLTVFLTGIPTLGQSQPADVPERGGLADLLGGINLEALLEAAGSDSSAPSAAGSSGSSSAAVDLLMGLLGISGRKISDCKISAVADQTYTGKPVTPLPVITYEGTRLKKNTDYTVRYSNNTKVGTAKCIITGKGNYEGSKTVSFRIVRKTSGTDSGGSSAGKGTSKTKTAKFTVRISVSSIIYNGKEKKPTVKVTAGKKSVPKTQYTVSYKNNKNVGKATVIVKGKGEYKGYQGETVFKIELKKTSLKNASSSVKGEIKAGWTSDSQADGYQLEACTNKAFSASVKKLTVKPGSKTTGIFTDLKPGKKYYVRIRSFKKVGNTNWYSEWSTPRQVTVKE